MSSWCEQVFEYREPAPAHPVSPGPMERLWHSGPQETVFVSAAELARREGEIHRSAVHKTEQRLQQDYAAALASARAELLRSLASLQHDRASYFRDMQTEVVRLALVVARTVVERELKANPAILEVVVQDLLERMEQDARIRVRVPSADLAAWEMVLSMENEPQINLTSDDALSTGQCILEGTLGSVEFDIERRLTDIERALLGDTATTIDTQSVSVQ